MTDMTHSERGLETMLSTLGKKEILVLWQPTCKEKWFTRQDIEVKCLVTRNKYKSGACAQGANAMFWPSYYETEKCSMGGFGRWLTSDDRCGQQARAWVLLTKTRGRRHRSRLSRNSPAPQTKKVSLTGVGRLICLWWILLASFLSSARHMAVRTRSRIDWQMPEQHFPNFMFTHRLQSHDAVEWGS